MLLLCVSSNIYPQELHWVGHVNIALKHYLMRNFLEANVLKDTVRSTPLESKLLAECSCTMWDQFCMLSLTIIS